MKRNNLIQTLHFYCYCIITFQLVKTRANIIHLIKIQCIFVEYENDLTRDFFLHYQIHLVSKCFKNMEYPCKQPTLPMDKYNGHRNYWYTSPTVTPNVVYIYMSGP